MGLWRLIFLQLDSTVALMVCLMKCTYHQATWKRGNPSKQSTNHTADGPISSLPGGRHAMQQRPAAHIICGMWRARGEPDSAGDLMNKIFAFFHYCLLLSKRILIYSEKNNKATILQHTIISPFAVARLAQLDLFLPSVKRFYVQPNSRVKITRETAGVAKLSKQSTSARKGVMFFFVALKSGPKMDHLPTT